MAIYCPATGTEADGVCQCGKPATTEIQCGWHNGENGQPSGGQYEEMCQECFDANYVYDTLGQLQCRE